METLGLIVSMFCFMACLFFAVAKITGGLFTQLVARGIGIGGCVLSVVYILKYFGVI
jgi:hypothetical protein